MALDRPDVAFATKELCRDVSAPSKHSIDKLKRLVRYIVGLPRLVWLFPYQEPADALDTYVDTDFAGCLRTRRSTSGGLILRGAHLIQHWSSTQTTVALSSGEAELSGICRGAARGKGTRSLALDLGLTFILNVHTDATAAFGICRRRGLGKVRHLAVAVLWVQDRVKSKDFALLKVLGHSDPADILTKHVDAATLQRALARMRIEPETGRASAAAEI